MNFLYALSYYYATFVIVKQTVRFVFHYVITSSQFVCFVLFFVTRHNEPANYVTRNQLNNSFQC